MRAHNARLALSLVRRHGRLTKTELARMTGLSAQTISVIMRDLEGEGLFVRGEPIRGRVGQPSVPLSINPEGAFFVGLKVGRRSADIVLVDFLGRSLAALRRSYAWPRPAEIVSFAKSGIAAFEEKLAPALRARIAGLGIAIPFEPWNWAHEMGVPAHELDVWRTVDLRSEIEAVCAYTVYLQNDATAACAAELVFGDHTGHGDFIYFYLGTFVGGGIVLDGHLYAGRTGNAGALGSIPVPDPSGDGVAQLIDVASIILLERMLVADGIDASPLWRTPDDWSGIERYAEAWVEQAAAGLSRAVVAAVAVIDFSTVIIDGGLPVAYRDAVVEATRRHMDDLDCAGITVPEIRAGSIGSLARALGAASLPLFDRYLLDPKALTRER
ncbi:ROK family transcriptional regulator [Pararhizobium mangrovi]|uniref:ROK family transcriptional regulator n=1 Tax=Pararhizobium mangrovi TaxID=2590452 RepID=A0A506U1U9_9HYPH|nr:ROK family transcriptional regulator [Pararhizobium mangrovi]TPW26945.1 ROK family transcriptional regulator [Pararhizobium mangrovi]